MYLAKRDSQQESHIGSSSSSSVGRPRARSKPPRPPPSPLLLSITPPCPSAEHWSTFPAPFLRSAARSEVCQLLPPLRPPRQRCRHQTFWCLLEAGCLPASLGSIGILPLRQLSRIVRQATKTAWWNLGPLRPKQRSIAVKTRVMMGNHAVIASISHSRRQPLATP